MSDNTPSPSTTTLVTSNISQPLEISIPPTILPAALIQSNVNSSDAESLPNTGEAARLFEDVDNEAHHICEQPLSYVPDYVLPALWRVIYWTSQVLTWWALAFSGHIHDKLLRYMETALTEKCCKKKLLCNDDVAIFVFLTNMRHFKKICWVHLLQRLDNKESISFKSAFKYISQIHMISRYLNRVHL